MNTFLMLKGSSYDYHDELSFHVLLGFLNEETNLFTGISLKDEQSAIDTMDQIKQYLIDTRLGLQSIDYVVGDMDKRFLYHSIDFDKKAILIGHLNRDIQNGYVGREHIVVKKTKFYLANTIFKDYESPEIVTDEELRILVNDVLARRQNDPTWIQILNGYTKENHQKIKNKIGFQF